jgi:hypothetical protein
LHVGEELGREVVARLFDGRRGFDPLEEPNGVRSVEFLGNSTRGEFHQHVVEAAHHSGPLVADVDVAFR